MLFVALLEQSSNNLITKISENYWENSLILRLWHRISRTKNDVILRVYICSAMTAVSWISILHHHIEIFNVKISLTNKINLMILLSSNSMNNNVFHSVCSATKNVLLCHTHSLSILTKESYIEQFFCNCWTRSSKTEIFYRSRLIFKKIFQSLKDNLILERLILI